MTEAGEELVCWQALANPENAALIDTAAACTRDVASIERLRRQWPADLVRVALELSAARRKARRKFPDRDDLLTDVSGIEQATSATVADHKAARFEEAEVDSVIDLCCGIGGDLMSLARVCEAEGVERSAVRCWMAERNAGCKVRCADVEGIDLRSEVFHFDPSRRQEASGSSGRRTYRLDDYIPGKVFLEKLLAHCPDGAVKLGPGVEIETLPGVGDGELEVINEAGALVQAVLWRGRLAFRPGMRTATRLPEGIQVSGVVTADSASGVQGAMNSGSLENYLFEADPAI